MLQHFLAVSYFMCLQSGKSAIMDHNATVTKIWCMLVIGDAISPLKFSKNKAKF